MRYLRTEKLRSFHLRPFIVLTQAKRAHFKAEKETTCSVNVLKLVSPSQPEGFRVRVRVGGGMRYLRTEKLRSFHLRPFIVLTITKRAHYKAERENVRRECA